MPHVGKIVSYAGVQYIGTGFDETQVVHVVGIDALGEKK